MAAIVDSFRDQSWSQRILRIWLGVTFLYAGWNKASDATFFEPASANYIGAQLAGFAKGSPIRPILELASHQPVLIGWLTLLTEMAIGIAILLNVASTVAAISGAFLSLTLWLSVSWQVTPYFLASDPAYFIMWTAYAAMLLSRRTILNVQQPPDSDSSQMRRRQVIGIGAVGGLTLLGSLLGRSLGSSPKSKSVPKTSSSNENILAPLSDLPVGSAISFTAANGDPAVLIRLDDLKVCAFDAICTHNGCTVEYDPGRQMLICPCHGAQYDPRSHAAVLTGPAPEPLAEIKVKIEGKNIVLG